MRYKGAVTPLQATALSSLRCIGYLLRCSPKKYLLRAKSVDTIMSFSVGVLCPIKNKWLIIQYYQGTMRSFYSMYPPEFSEWDTKLYMWGFKEKPAPTILDFLSKF
jgi:hypothetical protein